MKANSYILIVDDEVELLESIEIVIQSYTNLPVAKATSGNEAHEILKKNPNVAFILTDFKMSNGNGADLYRYVKDLGIQCPFVICSGSRQVEILAAIPDAKIVLEKPNIFEPLTKLLEDTFKESIEVRYVPIRIGVWLRLGVAPTDIYIKLSDTNYVRVLPKGEIFSAADATKYLGKKVLNLYFKSDEVKSFISVFSSEMELSSNFQSLPTQELLRQTEEAYEATSVLYQNFGWGKDLAVIVDKSYKRAIAYVSRSQRLTDLLLSTERSKDRYLVAHGHFTAAIACMLAKTLGWDSEFTFAKLTLAALIHDITIPFALEERILQEEKVLDSEYLMHPIKAAELIKDIPGSPPDVDQIIIQHHETPDGTGFPNQMVGIKISPLAAIFIVAQDLTKNLWAKDDPQKILAAFVEEKKNIYQAGHFRKILEAMKKLSLEPGVAGESVDPQSGKNSAG